MKVIKVFDNDGMSADRYTVVVNERDENDKERYMCLVLSDNCHMPNGVSMWSSIHEIWVDGDKYIDKLGRIVRFKDLSRTVRDHIKQRLKE